MKILKTTTVDVMPEVGGGRTAENFELMAAALKLRKTGLIPEKNSMTLRSGIISFCWSQEIDVHAKPMGEPEAVTIDPDEDYDY